MRAFQFCRGFSLTELMIGMFLSALLVSGMTSLLHGSVSAYRLQLSKSQLEESGRYARDVLISHISQAGFQPEPWQGQAALPALTDDTLNGDAASGDQLGTQRWSQHNCYGNKNPVTDSNSEPAFFLLQAVFRVTAANNLSITCRYGPDPTQLKTQINNYGLVEGVESMQVLYAEDQNDDKIADSWVTGQEWQQERHIRAVKLGLLLSTTMKFDQRVSKQVTLLDETFDTPADGQLRKVRSLTTAIRGRL